MPTPVVVEAVPIPVTGIPAASTTLVILGDRLAMADEGLQEEQAWWNLLGPDYEIGEVSANEGPLLSGDPEILDFYWQEQTEILLAMDPAPDLILLACGMDEPPDADPGDLLIGLARAIDAVHRACPEAGLAVILPPEPEADAKDLETWRAAWATVFNELANFDGNERWLAAWAEAADDPEADADFSWELIDLSECIPAEYARLYVEDGWLNASGMRRVAQRILTQLP